MVEYRATKGRGKGQWWPLQDEDHRSASFICPECGGAGAILDHSISEDGTVSPSVVCGFGINCDWHVMLVLEGWKEK